jgi:hypothetical protein
MILYKTNFSFLIVIISIIALIALGIMSYAIYGLNGLNIFGQIAIAVFLVILFQIISVLMYDKQYLKEMKNFNTPRKETLIIDGIYDVQVFGSQTFNTNDKLGVNYVSLEPSINQTGGAEYSYNFWLFKNSLVNNINSDYKVLFLRGSLTPVYYNTDNTGNCLIKNNPKKPYIFVKNPLVRLNKDATKLIIEYNTITNPDALNSDGTLNCNIADNSEIDNNMLGIYDFNSTYDNKFSMITIVIKESSSDSDILHQNNTNCKLYLNGTLVLDRNTYSPYNINNNINSGSTVMKNNKSPLYIAPTGIFEGDTLRTNQNKSSSLLAIADLKYFNYALNQTEITRLYNDKYSTETWKPDASTLPKWDATSDPLTIDSADPKPI